MIEFNEIKKAQFIQDFRAAEVLGREQEFLKANGIDWDIEKSMGEGSKGGKVIGHTKSGKPVYDSSKYHRYEDFDHKDHLDAAKLNKEAEEGTDDETEKKKFRESAAHHNSMSAVKDKKAVSMYNNWR